MNKKLLLKLKGLNRSDIETIIDQRVICHRNAKRNRDILKLAYLDGVSQEKIAEEYDLTSRQVQNIIYATERLLLKNL